MASTLIKVEIGAEIKKGTTSVGHGWGSGETMRALEKVGDRWTEGRRRELHQGSSRETLPTVGILPHKRTVKSGSKTNKQITDTAAVRPLPTRRAEF